VLGLTSCAGLQARNSRATEQPPRRSGIQDPTGGHRGNLAHLEMLPADKIVRREHAGQMYYVYADSRGCKCLYAGRQPQTTRTASWPRTLAVDFGGGWRGGRPPPPRQPS
jgi:hypothetical protein